MIEAPEKTRAPWHERRWRRHLQTSASQFETFDLCARKWWLSKVRGLHEPSKGSTVFGTCLHGVTRRYREADDLGRDRATGLPVDLYPPDWHVARDQFTGALEGTINLEEQDIIRRLVAKAIEEGVLERRPGRIVEQRFHLGVLEGTEDQDTVSLIGFIDCYAINDTEIVIEDDKSTKSMRYAKSAKALVDNIQLLIYAARVLQQLQFEGRPQPERIKIRHNVYCKDPYDLRVRKTEAWITPQAVYKAWAERQAQALDMTKYRKTVNSWHEIPDPKTQHNACNAYGGCPFMLICTGQQSEDQYEKVFDKSSGPRYALPVSLTVEGVSTNPTKGIDMTTAPAQTIDFNALMAQRGAPMPNAPAPALNPPTAPWPTPQAPAPAPVQAPVMQPPPPAPAPVQYTAQNPPPGHWYDPGTNAFYPLPPQQPQAPQPPQIAATPQPQAPAVQQPAAPAQQGQPAPWYQPGCTACSGNTTPGMNRRSSPCKPCETVSRNKGGPVPEQFEIKALGDGRYSWESKSGGVAAGSGPMPSAGTPVVSEQRQYVQPQQPITVPFAGTVPSNQPAANAGEIKIEPPTKPRGRPAKGFQLLVFCNPVSGTERLGSGRGVIRLTDVLEHVGGQIAAHFGKSSFYECDAFARRDKLGVAAESIAATLGTDYVVADTDSPDMKFLVEALMPFAGTIIQPIGR